VPDLGVKLNDLVAGQNRNLERRQRVAAELSISTTLQN
jgi:hypothetical protein